jgi:hypothetical protein
MTRKYSPQIFFLCGIRIFFLFFYLGDDGILSSNDESENSESITVYNQNGELGSINVCSQLHEKAVAVSDDSKVFAISYECKKPDGLFSLKSVHIIEIYSIMGRSLYKKNIPTGVKTSMFSQNGDYLAIQLSNETHFCLQFDKANIPFNINWRQAIYIDHMQHCKHNYTKYFR